MPAPRWIGCAVSSSAPIVFKRGLGAGRYPLTRLSPAAADDLDALIAKMTTIRTARAWVYKEQLREILDRKQINVVRGMLQHCKILRVMRLA